MSKETTPKMSSSELRQSLGLEVGMKVMVEVMETAIKITPQQATTAAQLVIMLSAAMAAVEHEIDRLSNEVRH